MLAQFFGDVLPASGHFALWTKTNKHHVWFDSLGALEASVQDHIQNGTQGLYFATAAFNEQAAVNGDKDARTQDNVIGKKCFYLDLDAGEKKLAKHGPEKVYATQRDAIASAYAFCKATGLHPTYLISSGEGLHLYWALTESVEPHLWKPVARRLSRALRQHGVKEDAAVTSDSARILRPIGTLHENGQTVRALVSRGDLWSFDDFSNAVANMLDDEEDEIPDLPAKKYNLDINKDVTFDGPPKSVAKIIPQCGALAAAMKARGNIEEPYWRAMLGVIKFTTEGDAAAHAFSSGHPDYSKRDTQFKLDHWKTGPTSCTEFAKHSTACATCQHQGKVKSPIVLGAMNDREVSSLPEDQQPAATKPPARTGHAWDGCIPPGFVVKTEGNKHTVIFSMPVESKDEDGETRTSYMKVPFTHDVFWFGNWSDAENTDEGASVFLHKWTGSKVVSYTMDQTLLANQQKLREFLASKSIHVGTHKNANKALEEYVKMQLVSVKELRNMPKVSNRFGAFITDEGNLSYAHGEYVITHTGEVYRAILSQSLASVAKGLRLPLPFNNGSKWEPDVWASYVQPKAMRHVQFLRKFYGAPELRKFQVAIMMALASPLMPFAKGEYIRGSELPPNGLTVSLYSQETARGKTSAMQSAMLAFGLPSVLVGDRNAASATNNSRIARLGMMGSFPVGMDEMGGTAAATYAEIVSAVANGNSKERATVDGGLRVGSTFALVTLMGANKSARDMIAASNSESNAVQYRLLELDVDDIEDYDNALSSDFEVEWPEIAECAGALGGFIEKTICSYGVPAVNRLVVGAVAKAKVLLETNQTDRFQYRGLGILLALHAILEQQGMALFDKATMIATYKEANEAGHSYSQENTLPSDGLLLLSLALHDLTQYTAVTWEETRRSKHVTKYDEPLVPVPREVFARHVVSSKRTYVSATALRDWCHEKRVSFLKLVGAAKAAGIHEAVYPSRPPGADAYNLLKGMRGSTNSMVSCYCFNTSALMRETGKPYQIEGLNADNVVPLVPPEHGDVAHDEPEAAQANAAD